MSEPMVPRRSPTPDGAAVGALDPRFEGLICQAVLGRDRQAALTMATTLVARAVGADRASVLVPIGRRRLRVVASSDASTLGDLVIALERYPELARVIASRQPVLVESVESDGLVGPVRDALRSSGVCSIAAAPVVLSDTLGILRATSVGRRLTADQLRLLETAATTVESAIATAESLEGATDAGWRELALSASWAVLEVALDGRVVAADARAAGALEMPADVVGRSLFELFPELAAESDDRTFLRLVDGVRLEDRRAMLLALPGRPALAVQVVSSLHGSLARGLRLALVPLHEPALGIVAELVHRLPIPLLTVETRGGAVLHANPAATGLLGGATPVVGRPLSDLVTAGGAVITTLRAKPPQVEVVRAATTRAPAWELVALLDADPLTAASERASALRATVEQCRDTIDELLSERNGFDEVRSTFLSTAAHELKTPLTVIQSYLEAVLEDLGEGLSDEQRSFIETALASSHRLRRLVVDLVDLAAIDSGKIPLEIGRVELGPVVDAVRRQMSELARRAGLEIAVAASGEPVTARADAGRVEQILLNLVDNAVKFTPRGGSVTIRTQTVADSVRLEVHDSGIGIPADRVELLFKEFSRLPEPDGVARQGSGLGLAISRRLALAMGGRIEVRSSTEEGSSFTVQLPRWPD